jgi:DNA-directed RNA polymerase beta subunit
MATTFNGRRKVRKSFGSIREVAEMPNLIEVQKASYDQFLLVDEPEGGAARRGLQAVFRSVFPDHRLLQHRFLEFVKLRVRAAEVRRRRVPPARHDVRSAAQGDAAPDRVRSGRRNRRPSVKDIKEQDVYMGDMPFMTSNGTFIVNGTERVIVSQMHRSPGVFFDHDKGKTHSRASCCSPAASFPIAAPGSTSSSTPRTSSTRASTAAARSRSPRCSRRSASMPRRSSTPTTTRSPTTPTRAGAFRSTPRSMRGQADVRPDRRQDRRGRARGRQEADRARAKKLPRRA